MHRTRSRTTTRRTRNLAAIALAAVLTVSAIAVPMALAHGSKTVAREATAPSLHKTVLTNTKGLTLYSLSVEKNG
jgi:predicted lipoprotein with Yx(FWY)xxD motif